MINLLYAFWCDDHPIKLKKEFQLDDKTCLGGVNFFFCGMASVFWISLSDFHVSSDAAGSLGFEAIFNREWFEGV